MKQSLDSFHAQPLVGQNELSFDVHGPFVQELEEDSGEDDASPLVGSLIAEGVYPDSDVIPVSEFENGGTVHSGLSDHFVVDVGIINREVASNLVHLNLVCYLLIPIDLLLLLLVEGSLIEIEAQTPVHRLQVILRVQHQQSHVIVVIVCSFLFVLPRKIVHLHSAAIPRVLVSPRKKG